MMLTANEQPADEQPIAVIATTSSPSARRAAPTWVPFVVGGVVALAILGILLSALFTPAAAVLPSVLDQPYQSGLPMGPGSAAPDFTLDRPDGSGQVQLSAYRGRPVWINFWATWCPHCVTEMNAMQKVYNKYRGAGLEIIGVDDAESGPPVLQFVQAHGYNWPVGLDPQGRLTGQYRVGGLPSHIFVDRKGIIQYRLTGELSPADMEKAANAILAP